VATIKVPNLVSSYFVIINIRVFCHRPIYCRIARGLNSISRLCFELTDVVCIFITKYFFLLYETSDEFGLFIAYGSEFGFICCSLLMSLFAARCWRFWGICCTLLRSLSYFLQTTNELELLTAYCWRIWVVCCMLLKNVSYLLHTTDKIELFAAYYW